MIPIISTEILLMYKLTEFSRSGIWETYLLPWYPVVEMSWGNAYFRGIP
jgi:hypothetical protein